MNSFLQGKKILSVAPLRPLAPPSSLSEQAGAAATPVKGSTHCGNPQPTVEAIKEGDKVVRLVVVCSCGERVEIECLYPPGS